MFQGRFRSGDSTAPPRNADLIAQNLPYSLVLGGLAFAFSSIVGMLLGTVSAVVKKSQYLERFMRGFILLGSTVPGFWLALLLILAFSVTLGWFPVSGAKNWQSLVLPVLTIGFGGVALVARVTRVALQDAMREDFVMLLHAKGLSPSVILIATFDPSCAIAGSDYFSTANRVGYWEAPGDGWNSSFGRPGLGSLLIRAIGQRDYPVVQGCLLMLALAVMIGTLDRRFSTSIFGP